MGKNSVNSALFKVVVRENTHANKVLFFLCSFRSSWKIYALAIHRFKRAGYEVVVYDINDVVLQNDNPQLLIDVVSQVNEDINQRIKTYKDDGITVFDGIGNSLGSFLLYNYAVRFPLRKVILNIGGYMTRVIFEADNRHIKKTRQNYLSKGISQEMLAELWATIDDVALGTQLKSEETLLFRALNDKYASKEATALAIKTMRKSPTKFTVIQNKKLGHSAAVLKNVHSKKARDFLLT